MIRETLNALGQASRRALQDTGQQGDWTTQVAHVREWSFAMPNLSRVTVANSPVHQVYVGLSKDLAARFGPTPELRHAQTEALLQTMKRHLVAGLPARRPIVSWEHLQPTAEPRVLRGLRSFIVRHHSEVGNLYLMADVASRCEYECLRSQSWLEEVEAQLLPADIGRVECVENRLMVDNVGTFLARCEHDLELQIPGAGDEVHPASAVVLRRVRHGDGVALCLSLDIDRRLGVELAPGLEIEGAFGAAGRVFRFRTTCLEETPLALDGSARLRCLLVALPERIHLDQRRQFFRVAADPLLSAAVVPDAGAAAVDARVIDLSFSGAGLALDDPPADLDLASRIEVRLAHDDWPEPLAIPGVVRRLQMKPRGRGRQRAEIGVEFVADGPTGHAGTQTIRRYVMARQRAQLAVHSG